MSLAVGSIPSVSPEFDPISEALSLLRVQDTDLYRAAHPNYQSNFSRDGLLFGMMSGDKKALLAQVDYSAQQQGRNYDSATGEEPGKIHHEFPSGEWRGKPTQYNACDTTALFLLAIAKLHAAGESTILQKYADQIDLAIEYVTTHTIDGLFTESPSFCGAENFALRVTYWKDSVLNGPYEEPRYPIVYSLVHFQNAAAIRAIGKIKQNEILIKKAEEMMQSGLEQLWMDGHFIVARDGGGEIIDPPSSDSLHALLYIDPDTLPKNYAQNIEQYMAQLETEVGYLTGIPVGESTDDYHTKWVWTHEQAILHEAARKHALKSSMAVSTRVLPHIVGFPELINPTDRTPAGNGTQLWSIGQQIYFRSPDSSYL
jgi:glycogen debranching enzyme